ncbi:MAG: TPD domain-containing protein, partial [archaeon]|nr:TPD domain-containing protein [archaeon]
QVELEKKMQIEAARLAATERKEITRLAQVELEKKMQIKKSIKKQKDGFWVKIFNKLISLIPKKRKKLPKSRQQTEGLKSTISEKKEVPHEKEEIQVEGETESVIDEIEEEVRIEEAFDDLDWEEEIQVEEETESVIDEIEEEVRIEEAFDDLDWEEEIQVEEEKEPVIDEIEEEFDELDWEEEIVPTIESGEVILAELRIAMRTEPSPINYIINMLTNKHDLSIQNAKYIINHIVSPISICKMLTDEQFDDFIQSLDKNNSDISKGGEIWTQVIQIIGLSSLTMDARVDIYNILSDGKNQNKISKRVITIALLLNALPINFKHWWSMDIFSLEVIEHYGKANKFFRNKKFPQEAIEEARMLICSYAIEKPKSISAEYNYAKQISGNEHENKTEKWLKGSLKDVRYITEKQIQTYRDKHYGNKYINQKITPDILLEIPIQLSAHSQPIHWIDAKNHFVDPALSSDENVQSICHQMNKYVRAYGPGLIVWGRNFSEEWNDATKGAVQHIKV